MNRLLILCILLSAISFSAYAQQADNVSINATDEELIISYDLIGRPGTSYDVSLYIIEAEGLTIEPKNVYGDIGTVVSGTEKRIVWDVYKDVESLSGSITADIKVRVLEEKSTAVLPTPEPPKLVEDVYIEDLPGQRRKSNKLKAGTKFAIGNSSAIPGTASNLYNKKLSWEGGLFLRWNALRKIYLQPELLYHRQAYEITWDERLRSEYTHHSARTQGIIGFSPFGGGLYIHGGPYYEYRLVSSIKEISGDNETVTQTPDFSEMNSETEPFTVNDYGYILGGNINFGKGSFALGAQVSRSLTNALNTAYWAGDDTFKDQTHSHRSLLFYIQKSF